MATDICTFGGGCFWCIDSAFRRVRGVSKVESGYGGGESDNPRYEQICTGATGHAEIVQLTFDNEVIDFQQLLSLFFALHNPTTLNRQGADTGSQYRSVVFYHNEQQRLQSQHYIAALNASGTWENPVVTEVAPLKNFFSAEAYHQNYYERQPENRYCQMVIAPKLDGFNQNFADWLEP